MTNLIDILSEVNGATFVGLTTLTEPVLRGGKSNPHKGRVMKRVTGSNVILYQNKRVSGYDSMVRRRLELEGKDPTDFVLSPRTWGERIKDQPIVKHTKDLKESYYLEVIFLRPGTVEYFLDGQPIAKSEIIGLAETQEGEQGGLDNKVILRTYSVNSIVAIKINKQEFKGPFEVAFD